LSPKGSPEVSVTKTLETSVQVLKPGTVIAGKYRIIEEIGQGGMGIVYKAEDLKLKRFVALKFLPPHLMDSPELKDRFLVEAQAAAALSHPNICVIYEVGESGEHLYIAMEFVEGKTLREKLKKGPLPAAEAMALTSQVAAGLVEAHSKGIIHRDIKSANIMVTTKGQAKVMDFGLAKLQGGSSLTRSQTTLGTVAYMSPEQARGGELDARTDIWSLGVVLYEMLTGKMPFGGDHDQAVIYSILHDEPEALNKACADLPGGLDEVVGHALAKKPADRYQTMEEFGADLDAVAEGFKPIKAKPRRGRRILGIKTAYVYSAVVILLALILGFNVGGLRSRIFGGGSRGEQDIKLAKSRPDQTEKSVAVLPFINDSPDQENTYFINGVMEEILNNLQKIKALRVISRTSVEQYRERIKSVREIAEELGVNYIVEGSAQKYGSAFRLRVQLIRAASETHLWGESFQQKITDIEDIFNIQITIAKSIAEELQAAISSEEKRLIEKMPAADLAVYDDYLKARSYWHDFSRRESFYKALEFLNSGVEKNPDWAPLYAGLADVWMWIQQQGYEPPSVAAPQIFENLNKAMALDPDLAEAHYLSGMIAQLVEWNWEKSEREFLKALAINPNDAMTRMFYAQLLLILQRNDEALTQRELAMSLDPFNYAMKLLYSGTLVQAGDFKAGLSVAEELVAADPKDLNANLMIEIAAYRLKDYDKVIRSVKYSLPFSIEEDVYQGIVRIYSESGIVAAYGELMKHLEKFAENNPISFMDMSLRYIIANQPDKAMDWIEKGFELHDPQMTYITATGQYFNQLFGDPRFIAICQKMNLPLPKAR
jgi:serine/threonine protein kinase